MAYCYPRGRVWWIGYVDEVDQPRREPTKLLIGKTKTAQRDSEFEALKLARELEQRAERVRLKLAEPDVKPMPFEDLAEKYLAIRASRKRSLGSIESRIRGHIVPHFRGRMSHLIVPADIDEFLGLRAKGAPCVACRACDGKDRKACPCIRKCHRPAKPETQKHLRNHLRSIFRFGIEGLRALRGSNPAALSEPIPVPKREPRVVPPHILAAFLAVAREDVRGIFAVCLYAGLRKIEALRIRVEDVDLEQGIILIRAPKTDDWRPVPIPPGLVPYLKVELGRARSEWLFPNEKGGARSHNWRLASRVRTTLVKAGLIEGWNHKCRRCMTATRHPDNAKRRCPVCDMTLWRSAVHPKYTLKDLRSTFATLGYEETGDAKFIQTVLGHGDPRTTDRYVKMRQTQLVAQGAKLKLVGTTHNQLTEKGAAVPEATETTA